MSEVSICNQALSLLGSVGRDNTVFLTSLDDDTNTARLCKLNYGPVRDAVLQEYDWTFATRWETLAAAADPSPGEFAQEYPLPTDLLEVLFVGVDYDHPQKYRVEGNAIRTDGPGKIQGLYRVEDTSQFPSLFTQALVARMAAELALPITNSRSLMENMFAMYDQKMRRAAARDGQQGTSRRIRSRWLTRARRPYGYSGAGPIV